ncbi:MAG: hypothetical protein JNK47_12605 [Mesorhizobium sp.]|nr:hypothetical protein [Mesorhizobium sp.]MBL8578062.1 hypothetical protein [Mesorhizobium sp.]
MPDWGDGEQWPKERKPIFFMMCLLCRIPEMPQLGTSGDHDKHRAGDGLS